MTRPGVRRTRPARARLDAEERRAQLVSLGLAIFATRSYDDVSIDDLARAAGISKGLLYHYFPTKRDYYIAALTHAAGRLVEETLLPASDRSQLERLLEGLEKYLDFAERHGPAYVALLRGGVGSDREVAAVVERTRSVYVDRILADLPPELATPLLRLALRGWVGFVEAVVSEWLTARGVPRDQVVLLLSTTLIGIVQTTSGHALQ